MHTTHYRPTRSQQCAIADMITQRALFPDSVIVVHHVIEDSFVRLVVQAECRAADGTIHFPRITL